MRNKRTFVVFTLLLISFCLFCSFSVYQTRIKQCWLWTCAPDRTFSVFDLNLPSHILPENAVIQPKIISSEPTGIESVINSFFWEESGNLYGGGLNIDRYGTEARAKEMFESDLYWWSRDSYEAHPELTYKSLIADEFVIGCGSSMFNNGYECSIKARYQEYVIDLGSSIGEQMSESQFEQLVIDIDQQMINFFSQK